LTFWQAKVSNFFSADGLWQVISKYVTDTIGLIHYKFSFPIRPTHLYWFSVQISCRSIK